MNKKLLILGSVFGLFAVIIGAFAAHGLKLKISSSALQSFETGVRYQMYHAFLLFFLANINMLTEKIKNIIFYLILFGVILFSGSIYLLATNILTSFDFKIIGFLTPIGGLFFIAAWILLIIRLLKLK